MDITDCCRSKKMEFIVDVQGYHGLNNCFVVKELCIIPVQSDAMAKVFCFSPPYDLSVLSVTQQNTNRWIEAHHHGITWGSGFTPYSSLTSILLQTLGHSRRIYVKGAQKVTWLKPHLPGSCIIDLEVEMGCPSLNKLPENDLIHCTHHYAYQGYLPSCAYKNVKKLLLWVMEQQKEVRCKCDCPFHRFKST